MGVIYSDQQIEEFIEECKPLSQEFLVQFKHKQGHKEYDLDVIGENGSNFRLILRQSESNPLDFSIILGILPAQTNKLFRIRRHNGKSHEHTNRIEKERFYNFHIHTATERYQSLDYMSEDSYAKPTDRFADIHTALECMLEDCNFIIPENWQIRFL